MHRFCIIPSLGMINRSVIGCQVELKIRKIFTAGLKGNKARLLGLSPVSDGVKAIVTDYDLLLVGDMGCHPDNEY